jgi:hypothetical protein
MGEKAPREVPERVVDADVCTALDTGYAQSKYIGKLDDRGSTCPQAR